MSQHVTKRGDDYLLSMPATLAVIADAVHDPDAGAAGKVQARRVLDDVIAAARTTKFEQVDILETLLSVRTPVARLLPVFESLVGRVGAEAIVAIIQRGLRTTPYGGMQ